MKGTGGDERADDDLNDVEITGMRSSTDKHNTSQQVTLDAISTLLDQKLSPVHQLAKDLRNDLSSFKASVREEFHSMGLRVASIEKFKHDNCSKIAELEKQVANIKLSLSSGSNTPSANLPHRVIDCNIVVGNIPGNLTFEDAKKWLSKHCDNLKIPPPPEVYTKGEFVGLLFAKCASPTHRDTILASIRAASNAAYGNDQRTWAKIDRPFTLRTVESALLAMRRMLISWEYPKSLVQVDMNNSTLKVAGKEIAKVTVDSYNLQVQWMDGEWEKWEELQSSEEMATIQKAAKERLDKAKSFSMGRKGMSKGQGPQ